MSNHLRSLVDTRKTGSSTKKAVLSHMADKAADDGSGIWASKQTMADELELGRSTVIEAINVLIGDGLLAKIGTKPCLNGHTTEYQINITAVKALELVTCHARKTSPGAGLVHEPDQTSPAAGPKPSRNHPSSRAKALSQRATPAPVGDSFQFEAVEWARAEMKWSLTAANEEFNRFYDSALSKDRQYVNWMAAWRNWCRSPYCKTQPGNVEQQKSDDWTVRMGLMPRRKVPFPND